MKSIPPMLLISRHRQSGVVLITGLIFMVVLTILAVAAMRSTTLEERMTGNARDRDMAFQSAEAALRAGEQIVSGASLPAFVTGTANTPRIAAGTLVDYWKTTHLWSTQSSTAWTPAGTYAAPRYVIEELGVIAGGGGGGLGIGPIPDVGVYRITARGIGSSANTMVILQAVYER